MVSTAPDMTSGSDHALLAGGGDDAGADGLAEDQRVAGPRPGVAHLLAGLHDADDRQAVLGFRVVHGVAADDEALGLGGLGVAALQGTAQYLLVQRCREAHHVQRDERLAAHGVHVRQRVGRGDGAELVGVIGDGREEVDGNDERRLVVDAIDRSVVARLRPNQQVGVRQQRNVTQDLAQVLKAQLGRSTRAVGQLGEADGWGFQLGHGVNNLAR